jgi:sortase (surface protein transpeptidase)
MVPPFDGHENPWVIQPDDWSVIADTPEPTLTLTTCHPKGSARQRLIARLKLVESPPGSSAPA